MEPENWKCKLAHRSGDWVGNSNRNWGWNWTWGPELGLVGTYRDAAEASLSPGIRSLIQRVEGSVREPRDTSNGTGVDGHGAGDGDDAVEDEDLARELQEIETLRNELSGLRDRITAADG